MSSQSGLELLRDSRNFRILWVGQATAQSGRWIHQVALAWFVLQLSNDPLLLGIVISSQFAPGQLLGYWGGLIADGLPKRPTMFVTSISGGAVVATLGLLAASADPHPWQVVVLALALGLVNAVELPLRQAFLLELVGRERLTAAVAMDSSAYFGTRIVGPVVAGILIGQLGVAACFFVNAAGYLVLAISITLLRSAELHRYPPAALGRSVTQITRQVVDSWRYAFASPEIREVLLTLFLVGSFAMNYSIILPVLARDDLAVGVGGYALLMSAMSVGGLLGAVLISTRGRIRPGLIFAAAAAYALGDIGLALSRVFSVSLLIMVLMGMSQITLATAASTRIQASVRDSMRGRVMALYSAAMSGPNPVSAVLAGGVTGAAGAPVTLFTGGLITAAGVGLLVRAARHRAAQRLVTLGAPPA